MPYHVLAITMAGVRQGALAFQRQLSGLLRESPEIKVYSVSPFDMEERRRWKERFGGDVVYFFNEAAKLACDAIGELLPYTAEISDNELPKRRTVVLGKPE